MDNSSSFFSRSSIIRYNTDSCSQAAVENINDAVLSTSPEHIEWLNTYGIDFREEFKEVIHLNHMDDFLMKLIFDPSNTNRLIQLEHSIFISTKVLLTNESGFNSEKMMFIVSPTSLWSIQEKEGDYFDFIRERLDQNKGLARKKSADYLMYLMMESIMDTYQDAFESYSETHQIYTDSSEIKPTPAFSRRIENKKADLFKFKKATNSLRDLLSKLEKVELDGFNTTYFIELKDQANFLIDDIEFELQQLESSINLLFSMQGHRLNEVMKTLTILSVIFIPLTFIAGIYGMNFKNMPELESENGYFIDLGVMLLITIASIIYFRRQKWF